jgi:oxalate decarboxylase/phosphoglucose isomerase-like protein (cupin superfamily)
VKVVAGAGVFVGAGEAHWAEHFRVPDLSCGTYSIPARGVDDQSPHTEDELYVCTSGRATLRTTSGDAPIEPGTVVYVPAGEEHRFVEVSEDLCLFVVFAPPEGDRATDPGQGVDP